MRRQTLVITDNARLADFFPAFIAQSELCEHVRLACSPRAPAVVLRNEAFSIVDVRKESARLSREYQLIISVHCKQLFPESLHERVECINIHPGYNPETRGWFPQVWAIARGVRAGFTVHRIDAEIDHGDVIDRFVIPIRIWDTSKTAYDRILSAEIAWISKNFRRLVEGDYATCKLEQKGHLYTKKDFESFCEIDLARIGTFREFYDQLRALSFDGHKNAYFIDPESGAKIFLQLQIAPEANDMKPTDSAD